MIPLQEQKLAVELVNQAREAGARLELACKLLGIEERTFQRWTEDGSVIEDKRTIEGKCPSPSNKLTKEECDEVIEVINRPEYVDWPTFKLLYHT